MVEIDEDIFVDLLNDRVREFYPAQGYDEEFWDECIDYLRQIGFMSNPSYNDPKYIIDNIAVNGEIYPFDECAENFQEIEKDFNGDVNEWIQRNGYLKFGDYVVIRLGL